MSQSAQSDGARADRQQASEASLAPATASSAPQSDGRATPSTSTPTPADGDAQRQMQASPSASPTPSTSALPATGASLPSPSQRGPSGQSRSPSQSHLGLPSQSQSPPARRPPFTFPASSRNSATSASYHSFFSSPLAPSSRSMSSSPAMTPPDSLPPTRSHSHSQSHGQSSEGHSRHPSREYKETLDAHTSDEKDGTRIINQYHLIRVIGQGAYGVVYKGCIRGDNTQLFAVKEFSKTRLRKSRRYESMRRPPLRGRGMGLRGRGLGGVGATPRTADAAQQDREKDPLELIRREIAIMKKLNHPHVITLIEALDDPTRDDLYMVLEYCPDGPIIDVKLHERHTPLTEEVAHSYFVQILLGIEYLHYNDIIHRDIKPDNILLCDDRQTCKIVDFGVSEMFAPHDASNSNSTANLNKAKGQGTPAFLSPELCSPRSNTSGSAAATKSSLGSTSSLFNDDAERDERELSGRRDDVWAFGVTFYCMVVGHLPFDKSHFLELYEAIRNEEPEYPAHLSQECVHLLQRFLTKDANERITLDEAREHPWVTRNGEISVLPTARNVETIVEVTEDEIQSAICRITSIFTIARAISKFKRARSRSSLRTASQSSDGMSSLLSSPGQSFQLSPSASGDAAAGRPSPTASTSGSNTPASLLSGLGALGLAEASERNASTWVTSPRESSSRLLPSRSPSSATQCHSPGSLDGDSLDQTPGSPIARLVEGLPTVQDEPDEITSALPSPDADAGKDDRQAVTGSPEPASPSATIIEDPAARQSEIDHIELGEGTLSQGVKAAGTGIASMASAVGTAMASSTQILSSSPPSEPRVDGHSSMEEAASGVKESVKESVKALAGDSAKSSDVAAQSSPDQAASSTQAPTFIEVLQQVESRLEHRMHVSDPISATKHLANRLHQATPLERLKHGLKGMGLDIFGSGSKRQEEGSASQQGSDADAHSSDGPDAHAESTDATPAEAKGSEQHPGYLSAEQLRADDSGRNVVTGRKSLEGAASSGAKVDKRTYMGLGTDTTGAQDGTAAEGQTQSIATGQECLSDEEKAKAQENAPVDAPPGRLFESPLVHSPFSEDISEKSAAERLLERSDPGPAGSEQE